MRKVWAVLIMVCMLAGMCSAAVAELQLGDTVTAVNGGTVYVNFGDSYHGFCADRKLDGAAAGDEFMVGWIENNVINNNTNEDVSNYIKLFFVDHFEDLFRDEENYRYSGDFEKDTNGNYVFASGNKIHDVDVKSFTQSFIWKLTDDVAHSTPETDQKIEDEVARIKELAKTKEIPDWGHTETYYITNIFGNRIERKVMFDFRAFYTRKTGEGKGQQDFFAFKAQPVSSEPMPTPPPEFIPTPTPKVVPTPTPIPPKTGDDTAVALWFGLLTLSALAMATLKFRAGKRMR